MMRNPEIFLFLALAAAVIVTAIELMAVTS